MKTRATQRNGIFSHGSTSMLRTAPSIDDRTRARCLSGYFRGTSLAEKFPVPRAPARSGHLGPKLRPFPLRDLCALVREISAPCRPSLGPGTGNLSRRHEAHRGSEEGETVHPGSQSSPFVTLTPSLPLISPAVACGHLPRAPVRSGDLCKNSGRAATTQDVRTEADSRDGEQRIGRGLRHGFDPDETSLRALVEHAIGTDHADHLQRVVAG